MMLTHLLLAATVVITPQRPAAPAPTLQRFALVVGANFGGGDRPKLQYAVSDAERFGRVMTELGGVAAANEIVLRQPKLRDFLDGLDALSGRVAAARRASATTRTEIVVYYSGHADEKGLLLGEDRVSYRSLRDKLDEIPADVRIAVLDACASGAFTRLKGGVARPPFTIDGSTAMRGHAFLTSSAETEAAQESDRIGASYFTHYFVSGLRGAADLSGDGRVTLSEAYQFAFTETLGRTVDTKGGAQHPSYDIQMNGAGDVVMTDVRQTTARLVLGEDIDGRFFVRTPNRELVVELFKPAGRSVELGLEPGNYDIRVERERQSLSTRARLTDGGRLVLDAKQFSVAPVESTRSRGDANRYEYTPPPFQMAGRQRVSFTGGTRSSHASTKAHQSVWLGDVVSAQYAFFINERLAFTAGFDGFGGSVADGELGILGTAIPVGLEWNPLPKSPNDRRFKPFVSAGIMPVTVQRFLGGAIQFSDGHDSAFGAFLGLGFDVHVRRWLAIGARAQHNFVRDSLEIGNMYGGTLFAMRGSLIFGKAR